ncbi:MAG: hypothetical protein QM775_34600 [Pirellulales bacterium]
MPAGSTYFVTTSAAIVGGWSAQQDRPAETFGRREAVVVDCFNAELDRLGDRGQRGTRRVESPIISLGVARFQFPTLFARREPHFRQRLVRALHAHRDAAPFQNGRAQAARRRQRQVGPGGIGGERNIERYGEPRQRSHEEFKRPAEGVAGLRLHEDRQRRSRQFGDVAPRLIVGRSRGGRSQFDARARPLVVRQHKPGRVGQRAAGREFVAYRTILGDDDARPVGCREIDDDPVDAQGLNLRLRGISGTAEQRDRAKP